MVLTRIWHETLDHAGNVRIVRPDVTATGGKEGSLHVRRRRKLHRELVGMGDVSTQVKSLMAGLAQGSVSREEAADWAYGTDQR